MQTNAIISLIGTQDVNGDEILELTTVGRYERDGNKHIITYEATQLPDMEESTTTLVIDEGQVAMNRIGANATTMIFEQGQRHLSHYSTPHGAFTIGVHTDMVNVDLDDNGGEIKAHYVIDVDNATVSTNKFHMKVQIKGEEGA
jgi:uncharacterized beta-barrel protein YwiB (DUF1934 family)